MGPVKLASKPTWVNRWEIQSMTNDNKTYVVGQKSDGTWGCACPRWIFSKERPRPDCKHILCVKAVEPTVEESTVVTRTSNIQLEPAPQPVFYKQTRRMIQLED